MTNYQIFRKIRRFIIRRVWYALVGFAVILLILWGTSYLRDMFPDYERPITILNAAIAVFLGWKIIRFGESQYRMAQVFMITELVTGKEYDEVDEKKAISEVRKTFKYSRISNLIGNIFRHKNFKKVSQYFVIMVANALPYMGLCSMSWVFAHPNSNRIQEACRAVSVYYQNRRVIRPKILKAFMREIAILFMVFTVAIVIETLIYYAIVYNVANLDEIVESFDSFNDTVEFVWDIYMEQRRGYRWEVTDVLVAVAIYFAWFVKVFGIRAYQMIGIIRAYLEAGRNNPPTDELYERLRKDWDRVSKTKVKNKTQQGERNMPEQQEDRQTDDIQAGSDIRTGSDIQQPVSGGCKGIEQERYGSREK